MDRALPPLITRLRRRLLAAAWFGVFAILFKISMAMACFGDGVQRDAGAASTVTTTTAAASVAIADSSSDGVETPCWHAGAGGCHCGCLHGSALPVALVVLSPPFSGFALPPVTPTPLLTPRESTLRPPIV
ncbi:MAG: hypothetical protein J0I77_22505 [Rudaea sp.]|uniref:hypothetical protein n=1 Tax=unclassified Rudaea TaxID=2627037 RepID=UPI0010F76B2D|nr:MULTISPECIES: hypothetical protein [unclassified Rudaea]MBN8888502.1 hypothetical protein [Rudaea sp.]